MEGRDLRDETFHRGARIQKKPFNIRIINKGTKNRSGLGNG